MVGKQTAISRTNNNEGEEEDGEVKRRKWSRRVNPLIPLDQAWRRVKTRSIKERVS
jgi:hypothetical protein